MWSLVALLIAAANAADLPDPLDPDSFIAAAVAVAPALSAAAARIEASLAEAEAARGLAQDPMLSASLTQVRLDHAPGFEVSGSLGLEPARDARRERAVAELEVARASRHQLREELELEAVEVWARWTAATAARDGLAAQLVLAEAAERAAEAALVAGRGELGALLEARREAAALQVERDAAETVWESATAEMNNLLHRPSDAELPAPTIGLLPGVLNRTGMHPELRVVAAERALARAELAMTEAATLPRPVELMAGVEMEMMPEHAWMGMAGVRFAIPPVRRAERERDAAAARLRGAEQEIVAMNQEMRAEHNQDNLELTEAVAREAALREVAIPAQEQQIAALTAGVSAGVVELPMLLMAQRELAALQVEAAEAAAMIWPIAAAHRQSQGAPLIRE